jgi:hypothetical protein
MKSVRYYQRKLLIQVPQFFFHLYQNLTLIKRVVILKVLFIFYKNMIRMIMTKSPLIYEHILNWVELTSKNIKWVKHRGKELPKPSCTNIKYVY